MPASSRKSSAAEGPGKAPRKVDWLLTDADWVVTCDESMSAFRSGAVAIDGDALAAAGDSETLRSQFMGRREMNMAGHLLLPGLVNTHTHAAMSCFRGLGDDLPLNRWLHEVIFPAEKRHVGPDLVYWGTLLSVVEMLLNGVTTFCDGYFFEGSAARAALDGGIRAVLGQGILDFPSPDQPEPAKARRTAEHFLNHFPYGKGRLSPSLFCHAPYTCGPGTLRWVKDLCRERSILFQIHLSETASEVEVLTDEYGKRPVHYLHDQDILDEGTLCAHGVWLEPDEMDVLARQGTGVSHNVESNMKLASGVAPVPRLQKAGVKLGLGTDGCASNNDLDLFTEMGKAARLHKVAWNDPTLCPASEVLAMATRGGAEVLGWSKQIGSLEAGKKADLVALDLNQPHLTPLYDPVSHLVYAAKGSDVRHVWVHGRQVVEDRRVLTVDADEVLKEIGKIAEQTARDVKPR